MIRLPFMDEMVRAVLARRKTVTRRTSERWRDVPPGTEIVGNETFALPKRLDGISPTKAGQNALDAGYSSPWAPVWYRADGRFNNAVELRYANDPDEWGGMGKWRPPMFMPTWASRLRLRVVSVTEQHSAARDVVWRGCVSRLVMPDVDDAEARLEGFENRAGFMALWNSMHPDYNGPVFRVQFEVIDAAT